MSAPTPEERIRAKLETWADLSGAQSGLEAITVKDEFVKLLADAIREAVADRDEKRKALLREADSVLSLAFHSGWSKDLTEHAGNLYPRLRAAYEPARKTEDPKPQHECGSCDPAP